MYPLHGHSLQSAIVGGFYLVRQRLCQYVLPGISYQRDGVPTMVRIINFVPVPWRSPPVPNVRRVVRQTPDVAATSPAYSPEIFRPALEPTAETTSDEREETPAREVKKLIVRKNKTRRTHGKDGTPAIV